jgi:type 1 fimbria pilin
MNSAIYLIILTAAIHPQASNNITFSGVVPEEACSIDSLTDAEITKKSTINLCDQFINTKVYTTNVDINDTKNEMIVIEIK